MYRPAAATQMTTPCALQVPSIVTDYAVKRKVYTEAAGTIFCNWKSFGGTERTDNNIIMVEDTAQVVCWYRPDVQGGCRLRLLETNATYEILGKPEDIELRHQYLSFKVRRVEGGA